MQLHSTNETFRQKFCFQVRTFKDLMVGPGLVNGFILRIGTTVICGKLKTGKTADRVMHVAAMPPLSKSNTKELGHLSQPNGDTPMIKRRNSINDQWSARRREMLESFAYRVLSQSAHRAISRIELELCYHGGNDNGQLPVTFDDFVEYGIDRASVAPALREGEALGFFRITDRGRGGNREYRAPNKFYLTFALGRESRKKPPTDEWRKIKTIEDAKAIARLARAAKDERAVAHGKRHAEKRTEKQKANVGNSHASMRQTHTENEKGPMRKPDTTGSPEKPPLLSISRVGEPHRPDADVVGAL